MKGKRDLCNDAKRLHGNMVSCFYVGKYHHQESESLEAFYRFLSNCCWQ